MGRRSGRIGGMDQPLATRHRFRFGLRTLLVVVALAAVASWGYWVGWPWWQSHSKESRFTALVHNIKPGMTLHDLASSLEHFAVIQDLPLFTSQAIFDVNPLRATVLRAILFKNHIYCVQALIDGEKDSGKFDDDQLTSIELFDLSLPPPNFTGTKSIRPPRFERGSVGNAATDNLYLTYLDNFARFIYHRKNNPGFQYELIYSFPP